MLERGHLTWHGRLVPLPEPAWTWPVAAAVSSAFTAPTAVWGPGHRGLDLAVADGTSVRAVADGVVRFAGLVAGVPTLSIEHGAVRSAYQPVTAAVRAGERVRRGQVIGTVHGRLAHCPASCLHVGARTAGGYTDPARLLERRAAVLKPLRRADAPG